MIEDVLSKIARQIMTLDEETLTALVPRYKARMLDFAPTRDWEESVVIYFLINGLRTKNSMFNDKIKAYTAVSPDGQRRGPHIRPRLRLLSAGLKKKDSGEAGRSGRPGGGERPDGCLAGGEAEKYGAVPLKESDHDPD